MTGLYRNPGKATWRFRYSRNGRQIRVSLRTRDEAEAIEKAKAILRSPALVSGSNHLDEIEKYFAERRSGDRLSRHSVANRRGVLQSFFDGAGKKKVNEITPADAQAFYDRLTVGEDSRQTYVRWLRVFFKWLIEHRRLRENPFAKVRMGRARPMARKNTLTKKQVLEVIEKAPTDELRFVLFCGFHAGMRKEEVIEARPEWFDGGQIHIGPTPTWIPKDREKRAVPISKAFAEFLKSYGLPSPFMLAPKKTKRGKSRYRYDFKKAYTRHVEACGLTCSFHDARRTFASLLVSAGVSIYKVANWLGDGVAVVEKHYGHLQPDNGDLERGLG